MFPFVRLRRIPCPAKAELQGASLYPVFFPLAPYALSPLCTPYTFFHYNYHLIKAVSTKNLDTLIGHTQHNLDDSAIWLIKTV